MSKGRKKSATVTPNEVKVQPVKAGSTGDTMKVIYRQLLLQLIAVLGTARPRSADVLLKIMIIKQRVAKLVRDPDSAFQTAQAALFEAFGVTLSGQDFVFGKPELRTEFQAEYEKLLDQEVEIRLPKLTFGDITAIVQGWTLQMVPSADEFLYDLNWLIDWDDVERQMQVAAIPPAAEAAPVVEAMPAPEQVA